jgi:hypothetical protein
MVEVDPAAPRGGVRVIVRGLEAAGGGFREIGRYGLAAVTGIAA